MSREELINKAAEFLSDPRISNSPLDKKKMYLKTKGLTDDEIDTAIKRSSSVVNQQSANLNTSSPSSIQPQYISSTKSKLYSVSKAQLTSLSNRIPSFGSLMLIFLVCYGIGAAITHLFKYTFKFWWPQSSVNEERLQQIEEKIESTSKMIENQVNDMKDIMKTLKTFLESNLDVLNSNIRYDSLKKRQESSDSSDLKKDSTLVRYLLSTVGTINRMRFVSNENSVLESFDDVKNEIDKVKGSIKKAFQGSVIPSVKSRSSLTKSDTSTNKMNDSAKLEFPAWMKEQEAKIPDWQKEQDDSHTTISENGKSEGNSEHSSNEEMVENTTT